MLTARARVNVRVLLHATPPRVRALLAHTPRMHARTPSQSATRAASRGHADGARGATSALALARGKARRGAARVWRPRERALAPARRAREQWRACRARALELAAKKKHRRRGRASSPLRARPECAFSRSEAPCLLAPVQAWRLPLRAWRSCTVRTVLYRRCSAVACTLTRMRRRLECHSQADVRARRVRWGGGPSRNAQTYTNAAARRLPVRQGDGVTTRRPCLES